MSLALTDPPVSSEVEAPTARFCENYLSGLSGYAEGLTVNEAEYHGLLLCLDLLEGTDLLRLVICGDSNLVISQVRGEIDCKAPGLTLLRQKALDRLRIRPDHELDSLASAALERQCGIEVETDSEVQDLITLNRLDEILVVKSEGPAVQISAVTTRLKARSGVRSGSTPPPGFVRRSDQGAQDRADLASTGRRGVDPQFEELSGWRNTRSDTGRGQILRMHRG
ncbi:reverse transcriptase [Phytophthora megakarya]|uniref:Reverse transcriptase n=1 Tax=Phytophthora megakarya TaxID=4795 RepID=A0A225WG45_9STRA|nr:reverse transcriptase [Phytophthora megakarya]